MVNLISLSQEFGVVSVEPFDKDYIKVSNNNNLYNLVSNAGKLVSSSWYEDIHKTDNGAIRTISKSNGNSEKIGHEYPSMDSFRCITSVNESIKSTYKDYDMRPFIVYPSPRSVKTMTKTIMEVVAEVIYYGDKLYLTSDGKLYTMSGERYYPKKWNLSYDQIKKTISVARETSLVLNNKADKSWEYNYLRDAEKLVKDNIAVYAFGYESDRNGVRSWVSDAKEPFGDAPIKAWGKDIVLRVVNECLNPTKKHSIYTFLKTNGFKIVHVSNKVMFEKQYTSNEVEEYCNDLATLAKC